MQLAEGRGSRPSVEEELLVLVRFSPLGLSWDGRMLITVEQCLIRGPLPFRTSSRHFNPPPVPPPSLVCHPTLF